MECPLCGETHSNADMLGHIWECEARRQNYPEGIGLWWDFQRNGPREDPRDWPDELIRKTPVYENLQRQLTTIYEGKLELPPDGQILAMAKAFLSEIWYQWPHQLGPDQELPQRNRPPLLGEDLLRRSLPVGAQRSIVIDAIESMVQPLFPEDNRLLTQSERDRLKALLPQIIELLEPFIEDGSLDIYDSYAPGGSFVPTEGEPSPTVFVADWNPVQRYDQENRELVELDNSMSRLGKILEALPGVEADWVDEIMSCSECNRAISTTPAHASWKPRYALVGEDTLCAECLQQDPSNLLDSLEHGSASESASGHLSRVFAEDKLGIEFQYHEYGIDPTEHDYLRVLKIAHRSAVSRVMLSLHELDSKSHDSQTALGISYLLAEDGPDGEYTTIYINKDIVGDWIHESYDTFLEDSLINIAVSPMDALPDIDVESSGGLLGKEFMSYLLEHPDKIPDWPRNLDKVYAEVKLRQHEEEQGSDPFDPGWGT